MSRIMVGGLNCIRTVVTQRVQYIGAVDGNQQHAATAPRHLNGFPSVRNNVCVDLAHRRLVRLCPVLFDPSASRLNTTIHIFEQRNLFLISIYKLNQVD
jgi:hypothetical protein